MEFEGCSTQTSPSIYGLIGALLIIFVISGFINLLIWENKKLTALAVFGKLDSLTLVARNKRDEGNLFV